MTSRNRIPSALEPYLRLPPETSLVFLTGTLGCSANWLTARFVGGLLGQHAANSLDDRNVSPGDEKENAVVFVSFVRDLAFWKAELRRTAGIDVTKLSETGRFAYVDCFTNLSASRPEIVLQEAEKSITTAITRAASSDRSTVLLLDSLDVLLALTLASSQQLNTLLLKLRSQVHSTVVVCSADLPFVAAATNDNAAMSTPIEAKTAAFMVQQAHNAQFIMAVRQLDTGAARDVSGILRVTRGGAYSSWDEDGNGRDEAKEMEALYLVQRDGSARVFERGAGGM